VTPDVWVVRAGQVPYEKARAAQKLLEAARQSGAVSDLLLLLEHPPVYTKGRRSTPDELPMGEDWYRMQGIEVCETDRGGRVTYHGPGQLVGYPIVSLEAMGGRAAEASGAQAAGRIDVGEYIRQMERLMIRALADWGIEAGPIEGLTGVWAGERKIGSIGVHVSRGVTTHGFAINVNNDLQPFEWIVPCGIESCRMTSLSRELGAEQSMEAFATTVRHRFADLYDRHPVDVSPAELAEVVPGIDALAGASPALR
jgi:lipoyl(octanoyl) transferase